MKLLIYLNQINLKQFKDKMLFFNSKFPPLFIYIYSVLTEENSLRKIFFFKEVINSMKVLLITS